MKMAYWSQLTFLEVFYIKNFKPTINQGLKASRELELFLLITKYSSYITNTPMIFKSPLVKYHYIIVTL